MRVQPAIIQRGGLLSTKRIRPSILLRCLAPVGLLGALPACGNDASQSLDDSAKRSTPLIEEVAQAMGGLSAVMAVENSSIEATGTRFNPGVGRNTSHAERVSDFHSSWTAELDTDNSRLQLDTTTLLLGRRELHYVEITDGEHGYVDGQDAVVDSPTPQNPMASMRIGAHLRHLELTSPLRLLRWMLANSDAVREEEPEVMFEEKAHRVLGLFRPGEPPLRIFIDSSSFLPAKLEVTEHHPPLGDSLVEVTFRDYRSAGDVLFPYRVNASVEGLEVHAEERTTIVVNRSTPPDFFRIPAEHHVPFHAATAAYGRQAAELLVTQQYAGGPLFYFLLAPQEGVFSFQELASGVHLILGHGFNQLLLEMRDHLVLVDAPLEEWRSEALLVEIRRRHPDKPIRFLVASHFHYDHVGGIRRFAAEGGLTVLAAAESVDFFKKVLGQPHTIVPDRLSANPVPVTIEPVEDFEQLTDGSQLVEIYTVANSHSDDLLMLYLPTEKLLCNIDLFSPGLWPPGTPAPGPFKQLAGELYDEAITRRQLEIQGIVGAHGPGTVEGLADLLSAAGR